MIVVSHNNEGFIFPTYLVMLTEIVVVYPGQYSVFVHILHLSTRCVDVVEGYICRVDKYF